MNRPRQPRPRPAGHRASHGPGAPGHAHTHNHRICLALADPRNKARATPPVDVGSAVVVRFPSEDRANAGYHIEGSYPGPDGGYWVNVRSKARGLLALFLFTGVGPDDAPTRLVCGSHLAVPGFLARHGEDGVNADGVLWYPSTLCRPVAHATGRAGDVFLCNPFFVHTKAGTERGHLRSSGTRPGTGRSRFIAGMEFPIRAGMTRRADAGQPGRIYEFTLRGQPPFPAASRWLASAGGRPA